MGLEVHCELATATKLFCGCPNQFGSDPNTNVCPVCLGLPGSLPVLNRQAVSSPCASAGPTALQCRASTFARKNYFYPDMPKDYQVSQFDQPINARGAGWSLPSGLRIGIERAHLEEDTGKSTHVGGGGRIHEANHSPRGLQPRRRAPGGDRGPPTSRTSGDAKAYVAELRAVLLAVGVSDAKMGGAPCRSTPTCRSATGLGVRHPLRDQEPQLAALAQAGPSTTKPVGRSTSSRRGAGGSSRPATGTRDDGRTHPLLQGKAYDHRYFPRPTSCLVPDADLLARGWRPASRLPAARPAVAEAAGRGPADAALVVERGLDDLVLAPPSRPAPTSCGCSPRRPTWRWRAPGPSTPWPSPKLVTAMGRRRLTRPRPRRSLAEMVAGGARRRDRPRPGLRGGVGRCPRDTVDGIAADPTNGTGT